MRRRQYLVDLTVNVIDADGVVDDCVAAHRAVLAQASPFLEALIDHASRSTDSICCIRIVGVDKFSFHGVLRLVYGCPPAKLFRDVSVRRDVRAWWKLAVAAHRLKCTLQFNDCCEELRTLPSPYWTLRRRLTLVDVIFCFSDDLKVGDGLLRRFAVWLKNVALRVSGGKPVYEFGEERNVVDARGDYERWRQQIVNACPNLQWTKADSAQKWDSKD